MLITQDVENGKQPPNFGSDQADNLENIVLDLSFVTVYFVYAYILKKDKIKKQELCMIY